MTPLPAPLRECKSVKRKIVCPWNMAAMMNAQRITYKKMREKTNNSSEMIIHVCMDQLIAMGRRGLT